MSAKRIDDINAHFTVCIDVGMQPPATCPDKFCNFRWRESKVGRQCDLERQKCAFKRRARAADATAENALAVDLVKTHHNVAVKGSVVGLLLVSEFQLSLLSLDELFAQTCRCSTSDSLLHVTKKPQYSAGIPSLHPAVFVSRAAFCASWRIAVGGEGGHALEEEQAEVEEEDEGWR